MSSLSFTRPPPLAPSLRLPSPRMGGGASGHVPLELDQEHLEPMSPTAFPHADSPLPSPTPMSPALGAPQQTRTPDLAAQGPPHSPSQTQTQTQGTRKPTRTGSSISAASRPTGERQGPPPHSGLMRAMHPGAGSVGASVGGGVGGIGTSFNTPAGGMGGSTRVPMLASRPGLAHAHTQDASAIPSSLSTPLGGAVRPLNAATAMRGRAIGVGIGRAGSGAGSQVGQGQGQGQGGDGQGQGYADTPGNTPSSLERISRRLASNLVVAGGTGAGAGAGMGAGMGEGSSGGAGGGAAIGGKIAPSYEFDAGLHDLNRRLTTHAELSPRSPSSTLVCRAPPDLLERERERERERGPARSTRSDWPSHFGDSDAGESDAGAGLDAVPPLGRLGMGASLGGSLGARARARVREGAGPRGELCE